MTTNGALLDKGLAEKIIPYLSWVRISLNAGTPKTYASIHGTNTDDFKRVIANISGAVRLRDKNKYACAVGVQMLLLKENCNEASKLAEILKKNKADYLIVKPYSQHPLSINRLKYQLDYRSLLSFEKELDKYNSKDFHVIFRSNTMVKISEHKPYEKCLGMPFWAYLSSKGDLYACSAFLGDERFCYGNIYGNSFEKLWKGKKRKKVIKMMEDDWDIEDCREVCRLDEINRYLWNIKNPPLHVNFI
jgi:cyclic pyranopterin phosphate synthase